MRAGTLREKIIIQSKGTPTRNAAGEEVISWGTELTTRAAVFTRRGSEGIEAGQAQAQTVYEFRCRVHRAKTITPAMRVSWDSRFFEITSIQDLSERGRTWVIHTIEEVL